MKRIALIMPLLAALAAPAPARAFVLWRGQSTNGGPWYPIRWSGQTHRVEFVVSDTPLELLRNFTSDSTPAAAVEAALQSWALAPPGFVFGGPVGANAVRQDGINLITMADTPENRDRVADANARTFPWIGTRSRTQQYWPFLETDIVVSPTKKWNTNGDAGSLDLQSTLTHELGHCLGLDHSPVCAATMFAFGLRGQTQRRTPDPDDLSGMRAIYEIPTPDTGAIAGQVVTTDGDPICGAHVAALDAEGLVTVGTLTDTNGSFQLPALPAGEYQVYAEPLAGQFKPANVVTGYYKGIRTDFRTAFAGGPDGARISVTTGNTTTIDPIQVDAEAPALLPEWVGWSTDGRSFQDLKISLQIPAGTSRYLVVDGPGVDTLTEISVTGTDIVLNPNRMRGGMDSLGSPFIILPLSVRRGARPGEHSLLITNDQETAVLTGAIEVMAP